ncbi:hypothetical protein QBC44DRAFT_337174 [Cladorrhinum sp. PSN332]|nr:hypothetical protein QBC44DRAFT_337174 [Cladorrhinum sp. PSN332]
MSNTTENQAIRVVWFEGKHPAGKSADILRSEHEDFKRRVLRKPHPSLTLASSKSDLDKQISDLGGDTRSTEAVEALQEFDGVSTALDAYQNDRSAGGKRGKRIASRVQHGLNKFAEFVNAFDGVLQKVASAGSPFGEVGYQTLSILLLVITTKTKNDNRVTEYLDGIRKSLPRLEVWKDIYPTDPMRDLVADAYLQVIEFSRSASEYLARFWLRFYLAVNPVATVKFEEAASGLHQTLAEINAEAMLGLHSNSKSIKEDTDQLLVQSEQLGEQNKRLLIQSKQDSSTLEELREQNSKLLLQRKEDSTTLKQLRDQNEELKRQIQERALADQLREQQQDMRMLNAFQSFLGVDPRNFGPNISAVKDALTKVFPNTSRFSPRIPYTGYTQINKAQLMEEPAYQAWISHPLSALLFLHGSTHLDGKRIRTTHSWLSPAAIYVAEAFSKHDSTKLAFFSCHPDLDENEHITCDMMLSSLILQTLQWQPQVLREKDGEFRRILEEQSRPGMSPLRKEQGLVDLLRAVLVEVNRTHFKGSTFFLVIDRLDFCLTPIKDLANELMRLVTLLGEKSAPRVKVMIVAERSGGNGLWDTEQLPEDLFDTSRLFPLKLEQRRLIAGETAVFRRPSIWSQQ